MLTAVILAVLAQEVDRDYHFFQEPPPSFRESVGMGVRLEWVGPANDLGVELVSSPRFGFALESEVSTWLSLEVEALSLETELFSERLNNTIGIWRTDMAGLNARIYLPPYWLPTGEFWMRLFASAGGGWNFNHFSDNLLISDIRVRDAPIEKASGGFVFDFGNRMRLLLYGGAFHSQPLLVTRSGANIDHDRFSTDTWFVGGTLEFRF